MNKKVLIVIGVVLAILLWRFILPLLVLAGIVGGLICLFECVTGIQIFTRKPRGG